MSILQALNMDIVGDLPRRIIKQCWAVATTDSHRRLCILAMCFILLGSCERPPDTEETASSSQRPPRRSIRKQGAVCARFSPDGRAVAVLTASRGIFHGLFGWRHEQSQSPFPIHVADTPEDYPGIWWQDNSTLLVLVYSSRELTLQSWNLDRGKRNWTTDGTYLSRGWCFPLKSGEEILTIGHTADMGDKRDICILDGRTGTMKRHLGRYYYPRSASVAGNGSRFCVVADGRQIHVWDVRDEGEVESVSTRIPQEFRGIEDPFDETCVRVNLSANGQFVAVWNRKGAALVQIDDLQEWELAKYLPFPDRHWIVGFIPGTEDVVSVNKTGVWHHMFEQRRTAKLYDYDVDELAYFEMSSDGRYIALATGKGVEIIDGPSALAEAE